MSFTRFNGDVSVISKLSDTPSETEGLSPDELKARFDLAGSRIKEYLNETLLPQIERSSAAANIGAASVSGFDQFSNVQTGLSLIIAKLLELEEEIGGSVSIPDNSVSTAKIQNSAVTEAKLATGSVTSEKVASGAVSATYSATLNTTWEGTGPYTKTVSVTGMLATDTPIIDIIMSGTFSTDRSRSAEFAKIYRAVTAAGSITFYAEEKPTVSLPVRMLCVRK